MSGVLNVCIFIVAYVHVSKFRLSLTSGIDATAPPEDRSENTTQRTDVKRSELRQHNRTLTEETKDNKNGQYQSEDSTELHVVRSQLNQQLREVLEKLDETHVNLNDCHRSLVYLEKCFQVSEIVQ